jgi:eukaryotic-like serine/threonine-protein kinase
MNSEWERVWEIFDEVAGLPDAARLEALNRLCQGDAKLRDDILQLLLAANEQPQFERRMVHAKAVLAVDWMREIDDGGENLVGERMGAWRAVREIGRGGMGVVFLGERIDDEFEQRAAIKVLTLPTLGLLERFRQERRILARFEHPCIARLIDGGLTETHLPYFVMEYVEGEKITDFCAARRLALKDRLLLFEQVCDAVQYAHEHLVVHRDLKPSNILVSHDGLPKLLDFGVAKILTPDENPADERTGAQFITRAYAAPEQIRGDLVTTATDVYALGAVLYEVLTEQRLRRDDSIVDVENEIRLPSAVAAENDVVRSYQFDMRGDLDRVVRKALQIDPARRYSSASALSDDLRNFRTNRPVSATPAHWRYRMGKFARRHRITVVAAALLLATIIAGIAGVVWESRKTHEQALRATAEARNAEEQAQRARAVRDFTVGVLGQIKPDATQGKPVVVRNLLDNAVAQLKANSETPRSVNADILNVLAELYLELGDYDQSERLLHDAGSGSGDTLPPEVRARTLLGLAATTWRRGGYPLAREYLHAALNIAQPGAPTNEPLISDIRHMIDAVEVDSRGSQAEPDVRNTLAYDQRVFGPTSEQVERDWETLAWVLMHGRKFVEMEKAIDHALLIAHDRHGDRHTTIARALEALAYEKTANLDFEGAERTLRQALSIDTTLLGEFHPDALRVQWQLLSVLAEEGRFSEVLPLHQVNLRHEREILGDDSSTVALTYTSIGELQRELGRFDEAEVSLEQARAIWSRIDSVDDAEISNVDTDLGSVFFLEGQYGRAETTLNNALTIARKYFPENSLRVRRVLFWLAKTWMRDHRTHDAIGLVEPIVSHLRDGRSLSIPDQYDLQYSLNVLAEAQLFAGDAASGMASATIARDLGVRLFPKDGYKIGTSLLLLGIASTDMGHPADAEPLLRRALSVRQAVYSSNDPRLIEVRLALARALVAQNKFDDASVAIENIDRSIATPRYPSEATLQDEIIKITRSIEEHRKVAHHATSK